MSRRSDKTCSRNTYTGDPVTSRRKVGETNEGLFPLIPCAPTLIICNVICTCIFLSAKRHGDSMDTREFAGTVKQLRRRMSLSQEKFAAEVGVTASTVNRWENERGRPSPLAVKQIELLKARFGK